MLISINSKNPLLVSIGIQKTILSKGNGHFELKTLIK